MESSKLQTSAAMSDLEKRIREKAVLDFSKDLRTSIEGAFSRHNMMTSWSFEGKSKALNDAASDLVRAASQHLGDKAVNAFLQTYGKLVQAFPQIVEDAHELGVEDGIRSSS